MVRFIKVVNVLDKITDWIPIVSTFKNAGILIYQCVHKVNKVANPVKTSWTDDIKIHVLSKSELLAGTAMIPFFGNFVLLLQNVKHVITGRSTAGLLQKGYLREASRRWHYGTKKHYYEITALYLARNPNRSEKKLAKPLRFAADNNKEVFELILNSRNWSDQTIKDTLKYTKTTEFAKLILDKYKHTLSNEDAGEVLRSYCFIYMDSDYSIVEFLVSKYPQMDIDSVGKALYWLAENEKAFKAIYFLLNKFPNIEEKYRKEALLKASKNKNKSIIELIEQKTPGLVEKNLDQILKIAANNSDILLLNWLSEKYKEKITPEQIGMILAEVSPIFFRQDDNNILIIKDISTKYPDLPGKCLVPALKRAATFNNILFKTYLDNFSQLEPQHLQNILNEAADVCGSDADLTEDYRENWKQIAELIQKKFPEMKAENPFEEE